MPDDLSKLPDPHLIARARQGDARAQEEIFRRHRSGIFRETFALLRDWDAADSLTNQTFINAFENIQDFEGRGPFGGWLGRIGHNLALNRLRDDKRGIQAVPIVGSSMDETPAPSEVSAIQVSSSEESPLDGVLVAELQKKIDGVLDEMRPEHRQALQMHLARTPHIEIAHALDVDLDTVRTFVRRARLAIEKAIEEPDEA